MRKRSQILAALVLLLSVCALTFICFWSPPCYYAGKPLAHWFQMLNDLSPGFDPPAEWKNLGTNEITVLIKALQLRDSKVAQVHESLFESAWKGAGPAIFKRLPPPLHSEDVALNALLILSRIGTDCRPAYPAMIHVLQKDRSAFLRGQAAGALATIDPKNPLVKPALTSSLTDTNLSPFTVKYVRDKLNESNPEMKATPVTGPR